MTNAELPLEPNDKKTPKKKKIVHQVCDNNTQPFTQENMIERLYFYTQGFPVGTSTVHKALAKHGLPGNPAFVDTAAYKCLILGDDLIIYPSNVAMPSGRGLKTEEARAMVGYAITQYKKIKCSYNAVHAILEKHIARARNFNDYPFRMLHSTRAKMLQEYFDSPPVWFKTIVIPRESNIVSRTLKIGKKDMVVMPWSKFFHEDSMFCIDDKQYAAFEYAHADNNQLEVRILLRGGSSVGKAETTPKETTTALNIYSKYGSIPVNYDSYQVERGNHFSIHEDSDHETTIVFCDGLDYLEMLRRDISALCAWSFSFPLEHFTSKDVSFLNAPMAPRSGSVMRYAFRVLSTLYPELVYYDESSDTVDFMPF